MQLSNIFINKLDNLVDSSDDKDIISRHWSENATSCQLQAIGRNRVADHSKIEEETVEINRVASHSEKKEGVVEKNRVTGHSERKQELKKAANCTLSDISFSIEEY